MNLRSPFGLLVKLFRDRFLENDSTSPGGSFQTNIHEVFGVLGAIGMFAGYYVMPEFLALTVRPPTPESVWALRSLRLFFPAYSFGMAGFAALFYWDTLFPDRRDFLILTPFPIRLRQLVMARLSALIVFVLMMAIAVNLVPNSMVLMVSMFLGKLNGAGMRLAVAQIAATGGASVCAFLGVAALQGILISVTSARIFRRVSPWIQMFGMSAMVMSIVGFPVYSAFLKPAVEHRQLWLYLFPPAWFSGLYEWLLGGPNQFLASLGVLAVKMTALAMLAILVTWGLGFRRHFRRTLEAEDTPHRPRAWSVPHWLVASSRERALFGFAGKTLVRSQKHQFLLATYLSVGISIAILLGIAVRDGKIALSPGGARAVAFVLGFFFVSGFRAVFQFPAELAANWLFRITEGRWTEVSRNATRKLVLIAGLIPLLVLALPMELAAWNWPIVLEHLAVQALAAALLVEALFWNFDKVPFTCSYYPGRSSLALLAVLYVYGITSYSFNMADVESAMEHRWQIAMLFFAGSIAALVISWRRHPAEAAVRFDGSEPEIQSLDLT